MERQVDPPAGQRKPPKKDDPDADGGGRPSDPDTPDPDASAGDPPAPKTPDSPEAPADDVFSGYNKDSDLVEEGSGFFETAGTPVRIEVDDYGVKSVEDVALYNPETGEVSVAVKKQEGRSRKLQRLHR